MSLVLTPFMVLAIANIKAVCAAVDIAVVPSGTVNDRDIGKETTWYDLSRGTVVVGWPVG